MLIIWISVGLILAGIIFILIKKHLKKMEPNKGIQQSTIDFIISEEGKKNKVYKDTAGLDTVGVGHLVLSKDNLAFGQTVSDETVNNFLKKDLQSSYNAILKYIKPVLNQNQLDALISLVFNIGVGGFQQSTVRKYINNGNKKEDIENAWNAWKMSGGKPILSGRRERELILFFK